MIIFENKGVLDIRAIKTFGVNSKDNKDTAIGYFGTGLKYALAILLRSGHSVSIITGGVNYKFGVLRSKIRNDEFDIVTMNDEELGFTTELGKDWKMWMAYREIHSNMLDENGSVYECPVMNLTLNDRTYVLVDGNEFACEYRQRDNYFLNHDKFSPVQTDREVDIYRKTHNATQGHVFFKGVRVMQTRMAALFDYNHHTGLTLTEDRTINDQWSTLYHVSGLVTGSKDKSFIKEMVMCSGMMYEASINYGLNTNNDGMETFLDVIGDLRKRYKDKGINSTAIELHKKKRPICQVMPGISCHLNSVQTKQFDKAVAFCKDTLELDLDKYKLIVAKDLGSNGSLGRADIENGIMYISKQCFEEGTKRVATSILEEYTHCHHEVLDETVQQKWVYLNQILSLGERLQGEPL